MNTSFRRTAIAAGMFTTLAGASMSANAMIVGDAGEANLVPFVVWDDAILDDAADTVTSINTIVKITVPGAVGNKTIPNRFTAIHTTPTNGSFAVPGLNVPPFTGLQSAHTAKIHWYFLDQKSVHRLDGTIPVTPNDSAVIDWGAVVKASGIQPQLNGTVGYLVLTTETASTGVADADFAFFAEAWAIAGIDGDGALINGGGTIGVVDAVIPVVPMADGADPVPNGVPTADNQVIQRGTNKSVKVSPLFSGIPTNWSDGDPIQQIKEVDVTLGNRSTQIGSVTNPFQIPTLVVVWNDRNAGTTKGLPPGWNDWSSIGVDVYNEQEESCSATITLPWQLNLLWVETDVSAPYPAPAFIDKLSPFGYGPQGQQTLLCVPPVAPFDPLAVTKLFQGGFLRMYLPEQVDSMINQPESAAVIFSIPLQYNVNFEAGQPIGVSVIPFETALGHDRGIFTQ